MDEALIEQSSLEFSSLMQRVSEGDEDAAWELIEEFGPPIIRVVRQMLTDRMRTRVDSTDFTQSVWASFFADRSTVERFDRPEALMAYLASIARHKVAEEFRRLYQTQKHDLGRERSLDGSAKFEAHSIAGDDLTPSQSALGNELFYELPSHYQKVVRMRRAGMTQQEIAEMMELTERTVRRILRFVLEEE